MIVEKIDEYKKKKIKQWPCNSNRASELGHPCIRYLVYCRTKWQEKVLHGLELQYIFDEGNLHESAIMQEMTAAGLVIIEQQRAFEWKEYEITGHIDGKLFISTDLIKPLEIKSISPFGFVSINTIDDIIHHKQFFYRKYVDQLTLYLLMDNKETGLFLFKNKTNGQLKELELKLDYGRGETLLKKAEMINKHVAEGTIPNAMQYDDNVCNRCGFVHICCPEVNTDELELMTDPDFESKLDRHQELKNIVKEYNKLDREVKKSLKEKKILIGNWMVTGEWIEKKAFEVKASKYWKTKITEIKEKA